MANPGAKLRAAAAETVDAVVTNGQSLDSAIADHEQDLRPDDRSLFRLLAYGALRHHWQLQEWISQLLSRPLKKRDSVVNALLAIGLYQLTDTRIPDHAVVSQTVEAVRQLRRPKLAGLVNACMRRFMREDLASQPPASGEARWNHPAWLIEQLTVDWPEDWASILEANNARAPMWLRINQSRRSTSDYTARLHDTKFDVLDGLDSAVCLEAPVVVDDLPGFRDGDVSVQDAAAQLAATWLLPEPGGRVLDACAAPGGKTGHLLERGAEEVVAVDSDAGRLKRVQENLDRLGRTATIVAADASNPEEWWDGKPFDSILLDAPCSAAGVIRRHPDIKLLRRESDIDALATLQAAILKALWPLLRPGGSLLYATCSTLAAENDQVTTTFLSEHGDAVENDLLPNNNIRALMRRKACGYQILPGTAGLDGFYYACFEKKKVS